MVSVGASSIGNFAYSSRAFTVASPTTLTLVVGAGGLGSVGLGTAGSAAGATIQRTPGWSNNSYFGHFSQGTGPNQAVLGGPSQTPCGWAPFTVISDARQKLVEKDYDAKGRGLPYLLGITPTAFRMNPEARYVDRVEKVVEVEIEGKGDGKPETEKRVVIETTCCENDGSRADKHLSFGFLAQDVLAAAEKAGVHADGCGVRDMAKEGGADMLILDTNALVADLVVAVKQLHAKIEAQAAEIEALKAGR